MAPPLREHPTTCGGGRVKVVTIALTVVASDSGFLARRTRAGGPVIPTTA
jgi:hypothetical protein